MAGAKSKPAKPTSSPKPKTATNGGLAGDQVAAAAAPAVPVKNEAIYLRVKHHKSTFVLPCSTADKIVDVQSQLIALLNPMKQDPYDYVPHSATGSPTFRLPSKPEDVRLYVPGNDFSSITGAPAGSKIAQHCVQLKEADVTLFHAGVANEAILIMTVKDGERFEPVDIPAMKAIDSS